MVGVVGMPAMAVRGAQGGNALGGGMCIVGGSLVLSSGSFAALLSNIAKGGMGGAGGAGGHGGMGGAGVPISGPGGAAVPADKEELRGRARETAAMPRGEASTLPTVRWF